MKNILSVAIAGAATVVVYAMIAFAMYVGIIVGGGAAV